MFARPYYEVLSIFRADALPTCTNNRLQTYGIAGTAARTCSVASLSNQRGKKEEKKKKKSEGGSQRKRAANRSECQTRSAWKALSEITSRHSWCEGGETADVNVVLTDWAMCTMSVITGSARWQDRSANLRGDRSGWSRAEIRRSLDELKNDGGEWQCVNTLSWAATMEKKNLNRLGWWFHTETGSNTLFSPPVLNVTPVILLQFLTTVIMAWDYTAFSWLTVTHSFTPHSYCRLGLGAKLRCICGTDWHVRCKNFNIKRKQNL